MANITTRQTAGTGATVAGVPLTNEQLDNNFINLNTELVNNINQSVKTDSSPTFVGANVSGVTKINELRYYNSFIQRFAYDYSFVSYLNLGETQKIFQITPSGASQNYSIYGKIYVQSADNTQILDIYCHLRSNTLPDLSWEIYYDEIFNGITTPYVKPVLWTKETSPAGFIFGIEGLVNSIQMATADLYVVNRSSSYFPNVQFLSSSEVSTIDTEFTSNDFTLRKREVGSTNQTNIFGSLSTNSTSSNIIKQPQGAVAGNTSTVGLDFSQYGNFYVTLSTNVTFTFDNLTNQTGSSGYIFLKQDATGGKTITLPSVAKTPGGRALAQITAANSLSVITYYVVDTNTVIVNYIADFK